MTHLIWYDAFRTKKSYKRKVCFIMYIRKSVLCVLTGILGVSVLAVLCVLFCFTQTNVPTAVYAAGWFGCLGAMMAAAGRISRE